MVDEAEPNNARTFDVLRWFDTGQIDLTSTSIIYEVVKLRGGQAVIVKALAANTGNVYVGKKDVTTSSGFELTPGESLKVEYLPEKELEEYVQLYAVAATAGDDVCYIIVP